MIMVAAIAFFWSFMRNPAIQSIEGQARNIYFFSGLKASFSPGGPSGTWFYGRFSYVNRFNGVSARETAL
jgi:hypothetical protein